LEFPDALAEALQAPTAEEFSTAPAPPAAAAGRP
jgi:hypothetical protein